MGDKTLGLKELFEQDISKVHEIKAKLSAEIEKIEENINEIAKVTEDSIEKIELKKKEMHESMSVAEIYQEVEYTKGNIKASENETEERQISYALLDETIANLDKQISEIQAEHDKTAAELSLKKRKQKEKLAYYEALNQRLKDTLDLLKKDSNENEDKLKAEIQRRTERSRDEINEFTEDLNAHDKQISEAVPETGADIKKRVAVRCSCQDTRGQEQKEESKSVGSLSTSVISSSEKSASESEIDPLDVEYLKRVFGKSVSLALAETIEIQPTDPLHYLAHWLVKYRYNKEINKDKLEEYGELMIEREKFEAKRWHQELEEEASLAVLEALFRAEQIIMQHYLTQQYLAQDLMDGQQTEEDYEQESFNKIDYFNV